MTLFRRNKSGLTLVEAMTTIVIIGTLTTLAIPQLSNYVHRMRIEEGKSVLHSVYLAQKDYFVRNNQYASSLGALDIDIDLARLYSRSFQELKVIDGVSLPPELLNVSCGTYTPVAGMGYVPPGAPFKIVMAISKSGNIFCLDNQTLDCRGLCRKFGFEENWSD